MAVRVYGEVDFYRLFIREFSADLKEILFYTFPIHMEWTEI